MLTISDNFLVVHVPGNNFQYLVQSPPWGEDSTVVPWIIFPDLLEDMSSICFPPVFGHFSCEYSKILESGLILIPVISLHTCGYISSGSMDLHMSNLLKYYLTWSFSTKDTFLVPTFLSGLWAWDCWKAIVPCRDRDDENIWDLCLFHALCHKCPAPFCTFFPVFLLLSIHL